MWLKSWWFVLLVAYQSINTVAGDSALESHRAKRSPVHDSIKKFCKEIPDLTIDHSVLILRNGVSEIVLYSEASKTFFLVRPNTDLMWNELGANYEGTFAFKPQAPFIENVGAFIETLTESFYAVEKSTPMKLHKVTLINKDTDVKVESVSWPPILTKVFSLFVEKDPKTLRAAAATRDPTGRKPKEYFVAVFEEALKATVIYRFDSKGDPINDSKFPGVDHFTSLTGFRANYLIHFRNTIKNAGSIGSTFETKDSIFQLKPAYFHANEMLGCPPVPCLASQFTSIMELGDGKKRVYFNSWYFEFKGFGQQVDYSTAKRDSVTFYSFFGYNYYYNTFLKDKIVHLVEHNNIVLISADGSREKKDRDFLDNTIIPTPEDGLFYRKDINVLYILKNPKGHHLNLSETSYVRRSEILVKAFFSFNLWRKIKASFRFKGFYEEKGNIYVSLGNMFFTFPASQFNDSKKGFNDDQKEVKSCFIRFFGCKPVEPNPGIADRMGNFPCGGLDDKGIEETTTTKKRPSTGSTENGNDTDKAKKGYLLWYILIPLIVGLLIVVGLVFAYSMRDNSEDTKSQSEHPDDGKATPTPKDTKAEHPDEGKAVPTPKETIGQNPEEVKATPTPKVKAKATQKPQPK